MSSLAHLVAAADVMTMMMMMMRQSDHRDYLMVEIHSNHYLHIKQVRSKSVSSRVSRLIFSGWPFTDFSSENY